MATHNVPAFVIGNQMQFQWASDDGEPRGTSGAPIIRMLTGAGITNVAVMITRYFGGIKLGTGGLARAYTATAKAALDAAGIVAVEAGTVLRYEIGYAYLDKLKALAERSDFTIEDIVYAETVTVTLVAREDDAERVMTAVTGLMGGTERLQSRQDCDIRI
jgi:uncharacterized YigZ family protein